MEGYGRVILLAVVLKERDQTVFDDRNEVIRPRMTVLFRRDLECELVALERPCVNWRLVSAGVGQNTAHLIVGSL
jgi:hypothetical protein